MTGPTGWRTQDAVIFDSAASGGPACGWRRVGAELQYNSSCVWKPAALLHASPERSEALAGGHYARDPRVHIQAHGTKGTEHNAFPVRSSLCAMGLADQLFRRECSQFCGGAGPDYCYAATGAETKAGYSRAGLASRCLAGFLERDGVERSSHWRRCFAGGCEAERRGVQGKPASQPDLPASVATFTVPWHGLARSWRTAIERRPSERRDSCRLDALRASASAKREQVLSAASAAFLKAKLLSASELMFDVGRDEIGGGARRAG